MRAVLVSKENPRTRQRTVEFLGVDRVEMCRIRARNLEVAILHNGDLTGLAEHVQRAQLGERDLDRCARGEPGQRQVERHRELITAELAIAQADLPGNHLRQRRFGRRRARRRGDPGLFLDPFALDTHLVGDGGRHGERESVGPGKLDVVHQLPGVADQRLANLQKGEHVDRNARCTPLEREPGRLCVAPVRKPESERGVGAPGVGQRTKRRRILGSQVARYGRARIEAGVHGHAQHALVPGDSERVKRRGREFLIRHFAVSTCTKLECECALRLLAEPDLEQLRVLRAGDDRCGHGRAARLGIFELGGEPDRDREDAGPLHLALHIRMQQETIRQHGEQCAALHVDLGQLRAHVERKRIRRFQEAEPAD